MIIKLTAQINKIQTTKDGGYRIALDTGSDSLQGIIELQKLHARGDTSLAIAIAVYNNGGENTELNTDLGTDQWQIPKTI